MPEKSTYNLSFRPESYLSTSDPTREILARITGESRRTMVREFMAAGMSDRIPDELLMEVLPTAQRKRWVAVHRSHLGGEYLPPLLEREIEIARVSLATFLSSQLSIRAKHCNRLIKYRIVDEYDNGVKYIPQRKTSRLPLTMAEMIDLIDGVKVYGDGGDYAFTGLSRGWRNWEVSLDHDPDDLIFFITITSEFYPELRRYYEEQAWEWYDVLIADPDEEEELNNEDYVEGQDSGRDVFNRDVGGNNALGQPGGTHSEETT